MKIRHVPAAVRALLAAAVLVLAACDGSITTEPDDVPGFNSVAISSVSVPSGSTLDVGTRVAVLVRYTARQRSDIQVRLISGFDELAASPPVEVESGRDEVTLVVTASRAGEVDLIEAVLGDPGFDSRIYDVQRVRWPLSVR